jgi:O-antigen/teichoic acid export membrane protein
VTNPLKKLAGQTVVYGLGTILPRFLNYFLTPILTRLFLPAEYGINSELYAYISFLNVIFTYGMETTFFNFNSKLENKQSVYNTTLLTLITTSFVFGLILVALCVPLANMLSTPNSKYLPQFIVWSVLILVTDAVCVIPFARMRTENKVLKFTLLKLLNVVVFVMFTLFFVVVCKKSYENYENNFFASLYNPSVGIGYVFLANLIANGITLLLLSNQFTQLTLKIDIDLLKKMLAYAWPLIILGLAGMVNETLDRIILKKLMVDKAEAQTAQGIYGACYKIAILMTIFIQAFRFAAEPFFFGKAKEKNSKKMYAVVMKYFIIFCLFLFLATQLNIGWIQTFIGSNYRSGLKVVPILLIANLCLGVSYNLSIWYKLSGQTKYGAVIALFGAAITLIINVMFVPKYSYIACAWATLIAYAGMMVISYFLGQKYFPIKYNLRAITVYCILTGLLLLTSLLFSLIDSTLIKLILNNMLVLFFGFVVYILEINNLKKINANVNSESN